MLADREKDALRQWYRQEKILQESKRLIDAESWEELEEHLHMRCLFEVSRHSFLPDYMKNDDGSPLFPTNLNPKDDLEKWQDAIEVAWEVMEAEYGLSHDEIHRRIASEQKEDWEKFMKSAEERIRKKKEDQGR